MPGCTTNAAASCSERHRSADVYRTGWPCRPIRAVRFGDVPCERRDVRQFLDIGTGLPKANNTHEVAQRVAPSARVVYVDNDPLVLTYARALLVGSPEGATDYIDADARDMDEYCGLGRK